MPLLPVDTAVVVEIGPCIDDTDFKTLETAIPYNAAGMSVDLIKNSGTAITKVDITPTTGGANDWLQKGNAVYSLEITVAQNDTEGSLRVVGVCNGVLPFESPVYTVVSQQVYNSLVLGTDRLEVDMMEVHKDEAAAAAAETMLDGTGGNKLTLSQLAIAAAGNDSGIVVTGSGSGRGVDVEGGATGAAAELRGGTTSGAGLALYAQQSGDGLYCEAAGNGSGLKTQGGGTGRGIRAIKGASGIADIDGDLGGLNEAIPGSPTADSINQRVKALDELLESGGSGDAAAVKAATDNLPSDPADQSLIIAATDAITAAIAALNNLSAAEANAACDTALADINLDKLLKTAATWGTHVVTGSVVDQIADDGTESYDRTTESLQALRDRGDAAWVTGGGGSITDILNVKPLIAASIDLANTATWRLGLMLTNALDDLPSPAEIVPGTIDIDRKAIGGTSWLSVVSGAACSEAAGLIYYDEVFDSASGYAEGDSIRVTFKGQRITVAANDYEISDATGRSFYSEIRQTAAAANVTLGAIQTTARPGNRLGSPIPLEMFENAAKTFALTVLDADGDPVDLSAKTLRFTVEDNQVAPSGQFKVEEAAITVSGDNNEVASVPVSSTQSATAGLDFHWRLWDTVAEEVLLHGPFKIHASVADVP